MAYPYITTYNKNLTNDEMKQNATYFKGVMQSRGWSINAIAAAFGNWQSECRLNTNNPQRDTYPEPGSYGFGLPQWTPWYRKYGMWCKENNIQNIANDNNPAADINKQLDYHDYECKYGDVHNPDKPGGATWYSYQRGSIRYSYSWEGFKRASDDVSFMARAYYWQYERSGGGTDASADRRAKQAVEWYKYLTGSSPGPDPQPGYQQGGYIILAVDDVSINNTVNIDNAIANGVTPERPNDFMIDVTSSVGKPFEISVTITGLRANIYKIPEGGINHLIVDNKLYDGVPQPAKVEIYKNDYNVSNLEIKQNGNTFVISGVTNGKKREYATCGIYLWYNGSISYGNETLSTQSPNEHNSTELSISFDLPPRKKRTLLLCAFRRRYPIYG